MRLAISQRVEIVAAYGERRDALDQAWHPLLAQVGAVAMPVPNTPETLDDWLDQLQPEGVVLTGGNDLAHLPGAFNPAPERDATEHGLLVYAQQHHLPVLAVCRGAQMMNVFLGGAVSAVDGHVACRHAVQLSETLAPLSGLKEVNSFHAWAIGSGELNTASQPAAYAEDSSIEAFFHTSLPWVGLLWHPEREASPYIPQDLAVLRHLFGKSS
ncbi:gamma-glutamyl-gamma-aminobutyrate hydrolase family protein [Saccharospirillum sp. HFRX-1]|uniref:gamma-glutamyl-gamma-aminobutyrate hydrolase family protein n=1 Tax=unclassified Saccharospirillum TaxID=2633430 RepID=UPI003722570C